MDGFTPVEDTHPYVKALIYGQPGSGKTRFCADAPKPIWLDFESSTETLRHWPEYSHTPTKRPRSIDELVRDVKKAVLDPDVDTVVLDTVTSALDFYMRDAAEKRASKRDKFEFWEADYKYATQVFTDLFGILQNAPINVVIIGHERIFRNNDTGKIESIVPDITPRLQQAVSRLVNVVAYLSSENSVAKGTTTRKLYLNRTNIIEAKNRLNIQDIFLENATWKEVF